MIFSKPLIHISICHRPHTHNSYTQLVLSPIEKSDMCLLIYLPKCTTNPHTAKTPNPYFFYLVNCHISKSKSPNSNLPPSPHAQHSYQLNDVADWNSQHAVSETSTHEHHRSSRGQNTKFGDQPARSEFFDVAPLTTTTTTARGIPPSIIRR